MKVRFLGTHNVETASTAMSCVLVDDTLALDAGSLTRSLSLEQMQELTAVLLSHGHFDHVRDIPSLGMNLYLNGGSLDLYGNNGTRENLEYCLINGTMYSRFLEKPAEAPTFRYHLVEPGSSFKVGSYEVLTVATPHSVPSQGYQITADSGRRLFYTGDTGPGLSRCFEQVDPNLIIVELTAPTRFTEFFASAEGQHLTPELLRRELEDFRKMKGYLPEVACIHMSPSVESEIEREIKEVAAEMNARIYLAGEGMELAV